jgi:hypothetical protein
MAATPTIQQIVNSFKTYGIGDMKHNRRRTISAFIVSICFIDQLASFRYPTTDTDLNLRVEKFLKTYVPSYHGIGLYGIFRNAIIHHYSGKRRFGITNDKEFKKPHDLVNGMRIINTSYLIKEVIKGFKKLEIEFLTKGSDAQKNALKRARKHPPFLHKII